MVRVRASLRFNEAALTRELRSRDGAVGRVMAGWAGIVTQEVHRVADERVNRITGEYWRGISSTVVQLPTGPGVRVVAAASHSGVLERGSPPHVIEPRRPGGVLRFRIGGRVVFARRVHHPGTQPYRIVEDGIRRAAERLGEIAT